MNERQTGYPSVDKPWVKYYREKPIREFNVEQCTYQLIYELNRNNLDSNAINFMGIAGNSWTYREMFSLADRLSNSFLKEGVKQGDTVLIATISGLEEALCLLALNKIGAVSKWIDITLSEEEIKEAILAHNCKYIVVFSLILPKIESILSDTEVKKVLVVEPKQYFRLLKIFTNSISSIKDFCKIAKAGKKEPLPAIPKDEKYQAFMEFVQSGSSDPVKGVEYDKDSPVLLIQSSGTTGKAKTIVHSNFTINCSLRKFYRLDMPLYAGNVMLKVAPAWVGYGLINTLALGLAYGMEVLQTPMLKDDMLITYNQKYDMVFGVPVIYRYLDSHFDEVKTMTRPTALISGGDKIEKTEINRFESDFASKGCTSPILNGAGSNEILGAGFCNPLLANKPGTVGIPMCHDIVSIFDPDTLEEKKYNEEGEVCINSETAMLYYENNAEETERVKRKHPDNSIWIHTGDIGKMDEDGYLYLVGRLSRVITVGAFKISASQIEEVAYNFEAIKEAVAVAVPDDELSEVPMLYFVINENYKGSIDEATEELKTIYQAQLKGRAVPKYYQCIEKIPYTANNKQDFRKLEQMGKEYVSSLTN